VPEIIYTSNDKVSEGIGGIKKKRMILRKEKQRIKEEKLIKIKTNVVNMNQMSLENEKAPRKKLVKTNQYTQNTQKTNEQLGLPTYNLDEEIKEDIIKSEEDEKIKKKQ